MENSMKPLVKTMAGVVVLLAGLAGCASKTTNAAPVGSGVGTGTATGSAPSAAGSVSPTPGSIPGLPPGLTAPGSVQPPNPSAHPTTAPGAPVAPTVPVTGTNVKYSSPLGVSVSADGKTLTTEVEWGGCSDEPQLIAVSQDSAKVVIQVEAVTHYKVGVMCPDIVRTGQVSLKLDAPLGNRQLVDGFAHVPITTR